MEVPVQGNPQHHGDLSRRAGGRLKVAASRHRNRGDEQAVILERGLGIRVYGWFRLGAVFVALLGVVAGRIAGLAIIFGLYDNAPAGGNSVLRSTEFVGFEEEAGEHGSDADELPVGQSDDLGSHRTEMVCLWMEEVTKMSVFRKTRWKAVVRIVVKRSRRGV